MKKEIAVGIFFFIAMGILSYYTIIMTGELLERRDVYFMHVHFTSVEGLSSKAKVKVNGVVGGGVHDIQLNEDDNSVKVALRMTRKFRLYRNYKISIRSESALGGRYVSIDPGKRIIGNQLVEELHEYNALEGQAFGDPLALLSELITENRDNVFNTIKNIRSITEKIDAGQGTLGKLINENKVHDNTDGLIKELRDAIEDTREQAPVTSFIRAALTAF
jgi:phospholipid/cholesterol/gamma-HCH transport system substrate-binding protein